jgi:hypothetical protein
VSSCPECGEGLADLKRLLYCRKHGAFDRSLRRVELTRGEARIADNMAAYLSFAERLKPLLEEKAGLLIKREKWRVDWAEPEEGPPILVAERVGVSLSRPGIGGPWTSYGLVVEYEPGLPPPDIEEETRRMLAEGWVPPLDREQLEERRERFSRIYGGTNAAGLYVIFTPEITGEAAEYCREQKTLLKLGMHGLAQVAFIAISPEYRVISMVSDRLRGYVKHHFPEVHGLLSGMEGWR